MVCESESESESFQDSLETHRPGSTAFEGKSEFSENGENVQEIGKQRFFARTLQVIDEV